MKEKERKVTNEKPVSLFPLDFKEAVAALLKVKTPAKGKPKRRPSKKKKPS